VLEEWSSLGNDHNRMPSNQMIPLLALQSRDLELRKALLSLQSFPVEREQVEKEVAAEKQDLADARMSVKEAEVRREEMEADTEVASDKIRKLKNQQLEVRKNDEYEALTHEIEALEKKIDEIEEEELTLLDEIEEQKKSLAVKEAEVAKNLEKCDSVLGKIEADEDLFRARLSGMEQEVESRRAEVDPDLLSKYDSLWKQIKRPPVVVPLEDQKCGGCHLRVSNEIDAAVQAFKPVYCDSCGRLLFLE